MEIDHDRRVVYSETLALASHDHEVLLAAVQPTEEQVMGRLTAPVVTTQLDTKNIAFERWAQHSPSQGKGTVGRPGAPRCCLVRRSAVGWKCRARGRARPRLTAASSHHQEQDGHPGLEEREDGDGERL